MKAAEKGEPIHWELLLQWMGARGSGSGSQFRDAIEYLTNEIGHARYFEVALRLSAMGHVEFDWSGPDLRWNAVPASCYPVERSGSSLLGLCGLLPDELREELKREHVEVLSDREWFVGQEFLVREFVRDGPRATKLFESFGVAISRSAYDDLRSRLPSVSALLTAGDQVDLPHAAARYSPARGQFEAEMILNEPFMPGCYRVEAYPRPTYCWLVTAPPEAPLCYQVDRPIGVWGSYIDSVVLTMTLTGGRLTLPSFPSLPVLYERMLYFAGARCIGRREGRMEFDCVSGPLIGTLGQKLPLSLEKA